MSDTCVPNSLELSLLTIMHELACVKHLGLDNSDWTQYIQCNICNEQQFYRHRRRKGSVVGGGHHGECGAQAYNGGLGTQPPAGSRGRALGQGGEAP